MLLRHLSQVWKVLAQTVPASFKSEDVIEMELTLREMIRGIDSSLLEEWERLRDPDAFVSSAGSDVRRAQGPEPIDITRDQTDFQRLVRVTVFAVLQDVNAGDWESAVSRLRSGEASAPDDSGMLSEESTALKAAFEPYFEERERVG